MSDSRETGEPETAFDRAANLVLDRITGGEDVRELVAVTNSAGDVRIMRRDDAREELPDVDVVRLALSRPGDTDFVAVIVIGEHSIAVGRIGLEVLPIDVAAIVPGGLA